MDKDRIAGAAKEAKGAIKETLGKVVGDAKLTAEGKSDKVKGKVQNAIGGLKDALRRSNPAREYSGRAAHLQRPYPVVCGGR